MLHFLDNSISSPRFALCLFTHSPIAIRFVKIKEIHRMWVENQQCKRAERMLAAWMNLFVKHQCILRCSSTLFLPYSPYPYIAYNIQCYYSVVYLYKLQHIYHIHAFLVIFGFHNTSAVRRGLTLMCLHVCTSNTKQIKPVPSRPYSACTLQNYKSIFAPMHAV